jgi:hypothetical protein
VELIRPLAEARDPGLVGCARRLDSKNLEETRLDDAVLDGVEQDVDIQIRGVVVVDARVPKRPRILTSPLVLLDVIDLVANACTAS